MYTIIGLLLGAVLGYGIIVLMQKKRKAAAGRQAEDILRDANAKQKEIILEAKDQALKLIEKAKREEHEKRNRLDDMEQRLNSKEENLEKKFEKVEEVQKKLEAKAHDIQTLKREIDSVYEEQSEKLQKIAGLSKAEAKDLLFEKVEKEIHNDLVSHIEKITQDAKNEAEKKANEIIAEAMQKYAGETVAESTVTTVNLPSDDMKGRVIGREGRNINTFERITGVDVIVDDTPSTVIISGFDMVRRYVAKIALEKLIEDGRIHPTRIEETVEKAKEEVNKMIKEFGEKVVYDMGITGLHPDLIKLIGRLRFRTSHGQNVLKHSVEVANISAALAEQLGGDPTEAKKAGLLHDIGKSVDHEISGKHEIIGHDIGKKYGLNELICSAIKTHHGIEPPQSIEAICVYTANMISRTRPGAKRDGLETYIKRLEKIEDIAKSFESVESAFAIQAGREVRIIVDPNKIDDLEAYKLASDIALKIEKDMEYPGQIKINVVRERRILEYAK